MKLKVFSIFDIKAAVYMTPFFMGTNGQAVRAFSDLVNDENSAVNRHPDDYRLFCIGEFDDADGALTRGDGQLLGSGTDFIQSKAAVIKAVN